METLYYETNSMLESLYSQLNSLEQAKDESFAQKIMQIMYEKLRCHTFFEFSLSCLPWFLVQEIFFRP